MRAMFTSFFRFFTAIFSGAAEYAEAFESTGKYVKKATDNYVSELEAENAAKLAEINSKVNKQKVNKQKVNKQAA